MFEISESLIVNNDMTADYFMILFYYVGKG